MGVLLIKSLKIRKNGDIYIQCADSNVSPLTYTNDFWGNGVEDFEKILKNFQDGFFRVNAIENNLAIIYLFLKRFEDKKFSIEEIKQLFIQLSKKEKKEYSLKYYGSFLKTARFSFKKGWTTELMSSGVLDFSKKIKKLTINEANFLKYLQPGFEIFNLENI